MIKIYERLETSIHPIAWIPAFEAEEQQISRHCLWYDSSQNDQQQIALQGCMVACNQVFPRFPRTGVTSRHLQGLLCDVWQLESED